MPPALARGDASELRRRLHALKGSSRNLGVPIIADACQALEARLLDGDEDLRPGLRGVAKVDAGERSRFWIWSHEISDWMRYRLWAWLP